MADVVTNIRGTTDTHERNNSVVVGAPKAAGTDAVGNNYTIRAGGNFATATITFTGAATADETIVIIDALGTSKTYTAKDATAAASLQFIKTDKDAAATALKSCIEHANGHNGTIAVADSGAGVLTLTQTTPGSRGNTTITEGLSNCTKTDFSGGTFEGGVNSSQDVGTLETKYTNRFDDPRYYSGDAIG
jgi:hypothetical protein